MHGLNFFNTPLAIDKNYLMSFLTEMIIGFKTNTLVSAEKVQEKFIKSLDLQMSANSNGASKYPVVFNIIGPIIKYSTYNILGTLDMQSILRNIDANPNISGVLFNIDSGGGQVSGTAEFADFIKNMKKPTIAFTSEMQCSAAEWIASACDLKIASPFASHIGSIGTYLSFQDFSAMFEKWGAKIYEIYAPQSTEKNADIKELIDGNEAPYKERLKIITDEFISTIKANYGEKLTDDGHVFKGKTYNATEALKIGLVDEIMTLEQALLKF
ncbi:MAG: S49 family peptidase [Chryseobacterium sp.]|nr:S49 family peptidase [Chryseobacterium sp.]